MTKTLRFEQGEDTARIYIDGVFVGELIVADAGPYYNLDFKGPTNFELALGWKFNEKGVIAGQDDFDRDGRYRMVTVAVPKEE